MTVPILTVLAHALPPIIAYKVLVRVFNKGSHIKPEYDEQSQIKAFLTTVITYGLFLLWYYGQLKFSWV